MGVWHDVNDSGDIYQFYYDNVGGTHFAGIYDVIRQLGIIM